MREKLGRQVLEEDLKPFLDLKKKKLLIFMSLKAKQNLRHIYAQKFLRP